NPPPAAPRQPVGVTATNTSTPAPVSPVLPPVLPAPPPVPVASGNLPTSLSAGVALVQGRLVSALTDLLQRGASVPVRVSTPVPPLTPYAGPDAALIELQREAIALALEALGTTPTAPQR